MTFDLKMSQSLIMIIKTLNIRCSLAENPNEKEYNFSLKMIGHRRDFNSEHSSNIKNPLFKTAYEIREMKEDVPENYSAKDFEEGKKLKTNNYFSPIPNSTNITKKQLSKVEEEGSLPNAILDKINNPTNLSRLSFKRVQLSNETSKVALEDNDSSPRQRAYLTRNESSGEYQSSPSFKRDKYDGKDFKKDFIWNYKIIDKDIPTMEVKFEFSRNA